MRLGTRLVSRLERAARRYRDDRFLAIRQEDGLFVTNWNLGLFFPQSRLVNSEALRELEERTDKLAVDSDAYRDVLYHIRKRGWRDILVGGGICRDLELVQNKSRESEIFSEQGWRVMTFSTRSRRYFVKKEYFEISEDVLGDEMRPVIFRPTQVPGNGHRLMLLMDRRSEVCGLISAITEWGLRNPIDKQREYEAYVRENTEFGC